jgi:hypothetical protein
MQFTHTQGFWVHAMMPEMKFYKPEKKTINRYYS